MWATQSGCRYLFTPRTIHGVGCHASVIPACFWPESSGLPEVAIRLLAQMLQVHMGNIYALDKLDEPGFRLKSPAGMTNRFPQMSNSGSPPAQPGVYPGEIIHLIWAAMLPQTTAVSSPSQSRSSVR